MLFLTTGTYLLYNQFKQLLVGVRVYVSISKHVVRSGIRTHAHRSGLRPERSALDRSAILTMKKTSSKGCTDAYTILSPLNDTVNLVKHPGFEPRKRLQ